MNIRGIKMVAWGCCLMMGITMFGAQTYAGADDDESMKIEKIRFSAKTVTRETYVRFLNALRNALTVDADRSGQIPILPERPMTDSRSYVHVVLNSGESRTVTFAVHTTNLYVVGYQANNIAYFFNDRDFRDDNMRAAAFPGVPIQNRRTLPFRGNYQDLGNRRIALGFVQLDAAVLTLSSPEGSRPNQNEERRALLIVIQMVAEASRFRNLERELLGVIPYGSYTPTGLMLNYQNSWGLISTAVQTALNENLGHTVALTGDDPAEDVVFRTVRQVLPIVSLLLFVCRQQQPPSKQIHHHIHSPLVRSILEGEDDDECKQTVDLKVQIKGLDGLCVGIKEMPFLDNVILQKCDLGKRQMWTFRARDKTIRSYDGRCLVAHIEQGYPVTLLNCDNTAHDWEMSNDGSIFVPRSLLSLTAQGYHNQVVVRDFYNASRQAWYATNESTTLTTIVAYNGLCLVPSGDQSVWLEKCKVSLLQIWRIVEDGTIRPQLSLQLCLKVIYDRVVMGPCDGEAEERWLFTTDGTIYNLKSQKVLQVANKLATIRHSSGDTLDVEVHTRSPNEPRQLWFQVW